MPLTNAQKQLLERYKENRNTCLSQKPPAALAARWFEAEIAKLENLAGNLSIVDVTAANVAYEQAVAQAATPAAATQLRREQIARTNTRANNRPRTSVPTTVRTPETPSTVSPAATGDQRAVAPTPSSTTATSEPAVTAAVTPGIVAATPAAVAAAPAAPPANSDTQTSTTGAPISPYIASIDSLHPKIQYELLRRSFSSETANTHMPFVRLTSLSNVLGDNLLKGEQDRCKIGDVYCPSLGLHGQPEVTFDDMFTPVGTNRSIVGYATKQGPPVYLGGPFGNPVVIPLTGIQTPVYVTEPDAKNDPTNIPMPGIVSMNTERGTAGSMGIRGGLFKATLNIKAYSTGQVNALVRYFLRPATRVILELGRRSSNQNEPLMTFDWNRPRYAIDAELEDLVTLKTNQRKFIKKYIYDNFGNYEIFIGYVVSFKIKYTKENTYEIELVIHSLQQFEVPVASTGVKSVNPGTAVQNSCKAVEIIDYFKPTSGWRSNSFARLMATATGPNSANIQVPRLKENTSWKDHVIPLRGPGSAPGTDKSPGYFISWEFFVNVLLNDATHGILSVFQLANSSEPIQLTAETGTSQKPKESETLQFLRSSVLSVVSDTPGERGTLNANEVSWSSKLRSIDPNVMVIYNTDAQQESAAIDAREIVSTLTRTRKVDAENGQQIIDAFASEGAVREAIKNSPIGSFDQLDNGGTSTLAKGVWLNTNAIISAFEGADTISTALNNLLVSMNNASAGFWNLQLLSNDSENPGIHVVDFGLSKRTQEPAEAVERTEIELGINIIKGLLPDESEQTSYTESSVLAKLVRGTEEKNQELPKYLYVFNRELQSFETTDVGSELLDITLESSLPQVIAVQAIAGIGGQMQRGTLGAIDINELRRITMYPGVYPPCATSTTNVCPEPQRGTVTAPSEMPASIANRIRNLVESPAVEAPADIQIAFQKTIDDYATYGNGCVEPAPRPPAAPPTAAPGQPPPPPPPEPSPAALAAADRARDAKQKRCDEDRARRQDIADKFRSELEQVILEQREGKKPGLLQLVTQYGGMFGAVLDLIEFNISKLQQELDKDSVTQAIHPFNSSNLTKTIVDFTMPGIGGLQLFQSFGVRRVPSIVDRGYYIITKVAHEFGDSGWITKVQGRFRFNPDLKTDNPVTACPDICPEPTGTPTTPSATPTSPTTTPPQSQPASGTPAPRGPRMSRDLQAAIQPLLNITDAEISGISVSYGNNILGRLRGIIPQVAQLANNPNSPDRARAAEVLRRLTALRGKVLARVI